MRPLAIPLLMLLSVAPLRADDPAAAASGPVPGPTAASLGAEDLSEMLESIRSEHELPALAAAVVSDERLLAAGAVGVRRAGHGERVGLDDKFHIGSCTKSMTATLCARLVERGRLRWDSTIGEVLAGLKDEIKPAWHAVTLEQLLCHRSGLPDDRRPGLTLVRLRGLKGPMDEQRRDLIRIVLAGEPATPPGTAFAYSNNGITIAAAMAEAAAGETWETMIRAELFAPLEMRSAGFGPPGDAGKVDQPWGHRTFGSLRYVAPSPAADNPGVTGPAGNVHCSVLDWARYARLHLTADRLLKPETFARLHTDTFEQGYAYGWGLSERDWAGGQVLQHGGSNTMWLAQIAIAPGRQVAVVAATNRADAQAQNGIRQVMHQLAERYAREPQAEMGP